MSTVTIARAVEDKCRADKLGARGAVAVLAKLADAHAETGEQRIGIKLGLKLYIGAELRAEVGKWTDAEILAILEFRALAQARASAHGRHDTYTYALYEACQRVIERRYPGTTDAIDALIDSVNETGDIVRDNHEFLTKQAAIYAHAAGVR